MKLSDEQIKHLLRTVLPYLDSRIENLKTFLSHNEADANIIYALSVAQNNSDMPHAPSVSDKTAKIAFSAQRTHAAATAQDAAELSACLSFQRQTKNLLAALPAEIIQIVNLSTLEKKSFQEISDLTKYSESQCKRRYQSACNILRQNIYLTKTEYDLLTTHEAT